MANYNRVILAGNLTRDPEIRYTSGGTAVATFGMAVNRRYVQGGETRDEVLFIDVVFFGKRAETVNENLSKGRPVLVEGRLSYRTWEAEGGQKRSKHEVVGDTFEFLGPKPTGSSDDRPQSGSGSAPPADDDIPF